MFPLLVTAVDKDGLVFCRTVLLQRFKGLLHVEIEVALLHCKLWGFPAAGGIEIDLLEIPHLMYYFVVSSGRG